jgi:hypothetical protein
LRTFGCIVHVNVTKPNLKKLDDRSKTMVFVGYEPGSAAYMCYDPLTKKVHISKDVIFEEEAKWDWSANQADGANSELIIEEETEALPSIVYETSVQWQPAVVNAGFSRQASRGDSEHHVDQGYMDSPVLGLRTPVTGGRGNSVSEIEQHLHTPPSCNLDAEHDDAPLRFRRLNDILGPGTPPGRAAREVSDQLSLAEREESSSFSQAEKEASWRQVMSEEFDSIEDNNTWELVDLPAGHKPIGLKWVYKLKKNASGELVKHKARLVAKGYVQREGVDFDEVFPPMAKLDSVRLLLGLAPQEGWLVHHLDVKSAFLNGELKEDVYVLQPPGFVKKNQEHKVYKLNKALYGLKQASRAWNIKLDKTLKKLGFVQSPLLYDMYARGSSGSRLLVGVYVDDLIIISGCTKVISEFKRQIQTEFKMSDLGPLSFYLGIDVHQSRGVITFSPGAYAAKIVKKAGMTGCNPCTTPMDPKNKLSRNSSAPEIDVTAYKSLMGSLRYLVNTRPDLAYSVGVREQIP